MLRAGAARAPGPGHLHGRLRGLGAAGRRAGGGMGRPGSASSGQGEGGGLAVEAEERVYRRYLEVRDRTVRHPGAEHRTVSYDLVGHPPGYGYALVFPFHTATREVTLVREWCQAPNAFMWGLPGGCYEPGKHATLEAAARDELSEEAHLTGGEWHRLLGTQGGLHETKWCLNQMHPFLCIDPVVDAAPGERDAEELLEASRVPLARLRDLLLAGQLLLPSMGAVALALHRLRELGHLAGDAEGGGAGLLL